MAEANEQTPAFSLEDRLKEIRTLLDEMQKGGASNFDEQVAHYKRGNQLITECLEYLDKAELQVEQLIEDKED